jgi:putative ubiquitin-RnfH superfamily antitoxin RatB of RatAB toxin-antitoxin module
VIVTVVYALPERQHVLQTVVAPGTTVGQAIMASGLLELEPALRGAELRAGVWNHRVALDAMVREGERIEVYRPLTVDPKEARRIRAEVRRRRGSRKG